MFSRHCPPKVREIFAQIGYIAEYFHERPCDNKKILHYIRRNPYGKLLYSELKWYSLVDWGSPEAKRFFTETDREVHKWILSHVPYKKSIYRIVKECCGDIHDIISSTQLYYHNGIMCLIRFGCTFDRLMNVSSFHSVLMYHIEYQHNDVIRDLLKTIQNLEAVKEDVVWMIITAVNLERFKTLELLLKYFHEFPHVVDRLAHSKRIGDGLRKCQHRSLTRSMRFLIANGAWYDELPGEYETYRRYYHSRRHMKINAVHEYSDIVIVS